MVAVSVICADTDEEAEWLAGPSRLAFVRLRSGRPGRLPTPEEAAAYQYSPAEQLIVDGRTSGQIVGDPDTVRAGLEELITRTEADELMITAMIHGYDARLRSFAQVAGLARGPRLRAAPDPGSALTA